MTDLEEAPFDEHEAWLRRRYAAAARVVEAARVFWDDDPEIEVVSMWAYRDLIAAIEAYDTSKDSA